MGEFEEAFSGVERVAESTLRSANSLVRVAKRLVASAKGGNIASIKRDQLELNGTLEALRQDVANAEDAWPFGDAEEEQYLRDGYFTELCEVAATRGLTAFAEGDRLIAHPSIVRTIPGSKQVKIDKKSTSNVRPSVLADTLLRNQRKPARFQASTLLQALHETYELVKEGKRFHLMTPGLARSWPWRRYTELSHRYPVQTATMTGQTSLETCTT